MAGGLGCCVWRFDRLCIGVVFTLDWSLRLVCVIHEATKRKERKSIFTAPNPPAGPPANLAVCVYSMPEENLASHLDKSSSVPSWHVSVPRFSDYWSTCCAILLRMNDYAPQMIVKTPSPWHVIATQTSTARTPGVNCKQMIHRRVC